MGFVAEGRLSDSPYVETVTRGHTVGAGVIIRPAESHWHMVLVRRQGTTRLLAVGPKSTAGIVPYGDDVELLWIKFRLGVFMPHLPTRDLLDAETPLPGAAAHSFWLRGSAWQFPDFENADTFVARLVRDGALARDPVVSASLGGESQAWAPRTVRQRFLRATGLTQRHIQQLERARRAEDLLRRGVSILDTVYEAGYCDQPHLTKSLKHWIGHTPAQLLRAG
jgi:diadenosine tetraphosphatase ApaH/serine/threonine PP2A family protein phosphatase